MYDRTESNMRKNTTVRSQVWDISLTPPTPVSFSLVYSLLLRIIACTHRSYTVKKSSQKGLTCSHPWFEEGRGGEESTLLISSPLDYLPTHMCPLSGNAVQVCVRI